MAKRAKETPPEAEIVQEEKPASEIVAVPEMQVQPPIQVAEPPPTKPKGPTFGQRLGRFFLFLFRLLLLVILLGALAVGLSYILPLVYQRYVLPVQENTAQLAQLKSRLAQNEIAVADLQAKLAAAQTELAQQAQTIADLNGRVQKIDEGIAAQTKSLAALEQRQSTLQAQNEATNAELTRQIKLLKSMELLSRARLFMYESNFGLARQDVQTARDLLAAVQPTAPAALATDLTEVIHRLDLTLANLPNFPVAASDDLNIAWQVLLAGLPQAQAVATETPIPEITSTPAPSPTVQPTATP